MDNVVELITNSETETCQLASGLSNYVSAGDFFGLSGDLGAGKSVFARAFLRALAVDPELEVPSPTFTLMQTYENLRINASHFDLYRIVESAEVDELGLEDTLVDGIALVEWPDRLSQQDFPDRLMIAIDDLSPTRRRFILSGHGAWVHKLERWHLSIGFLNSAGWKDAQRTFLRSEERRVGKECRSRWSPYH